MLMNDITYLLTRFPFSFINRLRLPSSLHTDHHSYSTVTVTGRLRLPSSLHTRHHSYSTVTVTCTNITINTEHCDSDDDIKKVQMLTFYHSLLMKLKVVPWRNG